MTAKLTQREQVALVHKFACRQMQLNERQRDQNYGTEWVNNWLLAIQPVLWKLKQHLTDLPVILEHNLSSELIMSMPNAFRMSELLCVASREAKTLPITRQQIELAKEKIAARQGFPEASFAQVHLEFDPTPVLRTDVRKVPTFNGGACLEVFVPPEYFIELNSIVLMNASEGVSIARNENGRDRMAIVHLDVWFGDTGEIQIKAAHNKSTTHETFIVPFEIV